MISGADHRRQRQPTALNASGLFPNFVFVANPYQPDPTDDTKQNIDCGMYKKRDAPKVDPRAARPFTRIAWSFIDLCIECKADKTSQDPFDESQPNAEPIGSDRQDALGQILAYAQLVFQFQQRMFLYALVFLGDFARIVRIDRSGIFATEKIDYKLEGQKIIHFLLYYSSLKRDGRGHDPTAKRIRRGTKAWDILSNIDNKYETRDYVKAKFKESMSKTWAWWRLHIDCEEPLDETGKSVFVTRKTFVVGRPHFQAPGVAGRGTRGYVALPVDNEWNPTGPFVYLKDAWRVDHPGIEREGDILKELNANKVPNVPDLVCHGDLRGYGQVTAFQDLWRRHHPSAGEDQPSAPKCPLKRHRHYRLCVKQVGRPLEQFVDSLQLIVALIDVVEGESQASTMLDRIFSRFTFIAHRAAYALGIIHRDISAGNILLYTTDDGSVVGLLNDWELAKRIVVDVTVLDGRQPDRTVRD